MIYVVQCTASSEPLEIVGLRRRSHFLCKDEAEGSPLNYTDSNLWPDILTSISIHHAHSHTISRLAEVNGKAGNKQVS